MPSPDEAVALSILVSNAERSVERLLIVAIAGWSVWLSFSLARRNVEVLRTGKVEVDATRWRVLVGSLALPVAVLPLIAACAFVGLGLTPIQTAWPVGNAPGQVGEMRNFAGSAVRSAGDRRDRLALVSVAQAIERERTLQRATKDAEERKSMDDQLVHLSQAAMILVGDVYGTKVQACIQDETANKGAGIGGGQVPCGAPGSDVRAAAEEAMAILGGGR